MFAELRKLALEKALEIMRLPLDPENKDFSRLMARQVSIMSAVVSTTARVEAAALRGRAKNKYDEILKAMAEAEKKNPN